MARPVAHASYGYNLGGPDNGWALENLDETGSLTRPWTAPMDDENIRDSLETAASRALLLADGVAPEDMDDSLEWQMLDTLRGRRGIWIDSFGNAGYGDYQYVLCATKPQRSSYYEPEIIDFTVPDNADENLRWALRTLDIVPTQKHAAWILYPSC